MKTIVTAMVGIATLVCGVIGSVATADHHKHQYLVSGMRASTPNYHTYARVMGTSGQTVTMDIVITDEHGVNVGSINPLTLQPGRMSPLWSRADLIGTGSDLGRFRTARITASEELWINIVRLLSSGGGHYYVTIPVHHRVLPCKHATYPCPSGKE